MASPEFTNNGITIQTLAEIRQELETAYKDIYGYDIDLSQNTPDGQRVGIEAKARQDLQSFAISLYNSLDANLAEGVSLDKISKICGIVRIAATQSTWTLTVTTDRNLTLETGYTVKDNNNIEWITKSDHTLTTGANSVSFFSKNYGAFSGTAGATFTQSTVILGITAISAAGNATVGRVGETDKDFRVRRNKSLEKPSKSTLGELFAELANLSGVTDIVVYENDEDTQDTVRNISPHTIWCVIEGGEDAKIAEVMAKTKTGGANTQGATIGTFVETITKPQGGTFVINHKMNFDRPTSTAAHIRMNAKRKDATVPIDIDGIKNELVKLKYTIGQSIIASELYDTAYKGGTTFILKDLEVSSNGTTWTEEQITPALSAKFTLSTANITVTEV